MRKNRRLDAGVVPAPTTTGTESVLAFLDCDSEPGGVTFSVLYADPTQPWGIAEPLVPFDDDDEGWLDD